MRAMPCWGVSALFLGVHLVYLKEDSVNVAFLPTRWLRDPSYSVPHHD